MTKTRNVTKWESQHWQESGKMPSVESNWTMFKRRPMQFPSWSRVWKQIWPETKKDNRLLLHQKRRHRLTGYSQKVQAAEERALVGREERFRAEISSGESVRIRHGILPCVSITSVDQNANRATNVESDTLRLMGSRALSRRKVAWKAQYPYHRSLSNWVVCFKILTRESLFYGRLENWDRITPSNSPRARGTNEKIWERKSPSRGVMQKCEPRSAVRAPRKMRRRVARDLAKSIQKVKNTDRATFYSPLLKPGQRRRPLQNLQRNENSWLTLEHQWTCWAKRIWPQTKWRSRNPTTVITASGEVQASEEAQAYLHDLDLFVTVQIRLPSCQLANSAKSTVIPVSGQKPHPRMGKYMQDRHFRPRCCPRIVIKLQRKFVFYIVPAGLIKHLSESSKFTKWRHLSSSAGRPTGWSIHQEQK